jgi:IS30 family transposase
MGRPGFGPGVRSVFWSEIGKGVSWRRAAVAAGVSQSTGRAWVAEHVRMRTDQERGLRLSLAERIEIGLRVEDGWSARRIGRSLGRPASTITRELGRNRHSATGEYRPAPADAMAKGRAARPKKSKLARCPKLAGEVIRRLELRHSPEQIAARLKVDFPHDGSMQISHETIYQELYVHTRGGLDRDLTRCLRSGRVRRRPPRSRAGKGGPGPIQGMVTIAERPVEVSQRVVPGHWEGDLITGAANQSAIGTLVELTTSFTLLVPLPNGHTAPEVQAGIAAVFGQLPAHLRLSLTWDRGGEMAHHHVLTAATGTQVYFCDPHSPWQRPSNENTNGLLRQYFPKGTNLSAHTAEHIANVEAEFNDRPRKRLGWKTPAEALADLLQSPPTTSSVALTP